MAAPIDLRNDFDSVSLRRLAKRTRDATQSRRLLALAEVYDGGSRTDASRVDGVVRWRRKDLARWLLETFAVSLDETTVGRELKALGFAKISARPRHYAQNELAVEAFKKTSPPNWRRSGRGSRKASR